MKTLQLCILVGTVFIVLAACAPSSDSTPSTGTDQPEINLAETSWELVSYGEPGLETPVIESTEVTLQFEDSNQAGGSGGCNSFGAQYETMGENELSITEIVSTLMACTDEGVMEQEGRYFEALRTANNYELTSDRLIIWYESGQSALNFSRVDNGTN